MALTSSLSLKTPGGGASPPSGKWTITDDLGDKVADETIRYTSNTSYLGTNNVQAAHVIAPGERFVIIDQAITGEQDKTFAAAKDNLGKCGILPITEVLKESKLDDYKVKKKIVWEVQKVVLR